MLKYLISFICFPLIHSLILSTDYYFYGKVKFVGYRNGTQNPTTINKIADTINVEIKDFFNLDEFEKKEVNRY